MSLRPEGRVEKWKTRLKPRNNLEHHQAGSGEPLYPDVVDAFFAIEDKILAYREQYKDEHRSRLAQMVG